MLSFVLREYVEYCVSCSSTVFTAALDTMKAFDRVNHKFSLNPAILVYQFASFDVS